MTALRSETPEFFSEDESPVPAWRGVGRMRCPACMRWFPSRSAWEDHVRSQNPWLCLFCFESFDTGQEYDSHALRSHQQPAWSHEAVSLVGYSGRRQ